METGKDVCRRAASVSFWDGYAPWYKLWIEHTRYHDRIIETLTAMVEPGWKVLDIGAGNGILSLPLSAIGCHVTALEPSVGMRALLFEESMKRGIDRINVEDRKWEYIRATEFAGYDLVMACNSLHLTARGFERFLSPAFRVGARNVFVVTERLPNVRIPWSYGDHSMLFTGSYETESSFFYHEMDEVWEHHIYKKGGALTSLEKIGIQAKLHYENNHICIRDNACVYMYWWAE